MLTLFADDEALFGAIMAGASGHLLSQIESTKSWAQCARSQRAVGAPA